ncbi:hypothetical protein Pmani_004539 [Petrolisthes manimaculis]|uniref:Uncharacterized protein n=1 Tax=Petrolisthes manimaculis TaxID=1843537 RepID=A0AAE1UNY2_9EUCA|nr:hypothetical protein Pmani_004539 [Petrolisthes manimaculis]
MYRTVFLVACVALMSPTPVMAQSNTCQYDNKAINGCDVYYFTSLNGTDDEICPLFRGISPENLFSFKRSENFGYILLKFSQFYYELNVKTIKIDNNRWMKDTQSWYFMEVRKEYIGVHNYGTQNAYTLHINGERTESVTFVNNQVVGKVDGFIRGSAFYAPKCYIRQTPRTPQTNPTSSTPAFPPLYLKVVGYVVLSVVIIITIITVLILVTRQLSSSPSRSRQDAPETQAPPETSPTPPGDDAENHVYMEPIQFV